MATESIKLPGPLIQKVMEAAAQEEISPEEFVRAAVEIRLNRGEWRKTIAFGHQNARSRGLTPEDVEAEITADRLEHGR